MKRGVLVVTVDQQDHTSGLLGYTARNNWHYESSGEYKAGIPINSEQSFIATFTHKPGLQLVSTGTSSSPRHLSKQGRC